MRFLQTLTPTTIVTAFVVINVLSFAAFGIDKARAVRGYRRTREDTLLLLALLGGTSGAYAGRWLFRHKTRKQPFSRYLHTIAVLQVIALVWFVVTYRPA